VLGSWGLGVLCGVWAGCSLSVEGALWGIRRMGFSWVCVQFVMWWVGCGVKEGECVWVEGTREIQWQLCHHLAVQASTFVRYGIDCSCGGGLIPVLFGWFPPQLIWVWF